MDVKRYFVSPQESGQICMLACMLRSNREIFFPKFQECQMMTFDRIARELLQANGYDVLECSSEKEALEKAKGLKSGSKEYPVFFSISDTSGEKAFEEFYTKMETIDWHRMKALGIITGKERPNQEHLMEFLTRLENKFLPDIATKEEVVSVIRSYLPEFEHREMGKALDEKM